MNNTKRILSALLALMTVSGVFASCSSGNADTSDTTQANTTVEITEVTETEKQYIPDLPEEDFGGRELKLLTWAVDSAAITDFCAYETNGEPLNDAIFDRNSAVEERYNMKLTIDERVRAESSGIASQAILAGEDQWGILDIGASNLLSFSKSGYLCDLLSLDYLDLEADWWDHRCIEGMSILGRLFILMGDINIFDNSETYGMIFNKEMAESFSLGSLYSLVDDGTWTIDKLYEMIQTVASDLNGDGIMDQNDRWGMFTQGDMCQYFLGAGERIARKDEDDVPYLTANSERGISVLEKAFELTTDSKTVFLTPKWTHLTSGNIFIDVVIPMFKNNQGLFYFTAIGNTYKHLRAMESEYGIVPVPKFEETQDEYYNGLLPSWATAVSIPVTSGDPDFSAFILEALSAESVLTVSKTYNELSFNTKGLRDEDSIRMAELISDTHSFDIGFLNDWGGIATMINGLINGTEMNFASKYASLEKSAQTALADTVEMYESFE